MLIQTVLRRTSIFLLQLTFFGLTQEYRFDLFRTIHEILYHGGGGYDYSTVYNMPVWLRKFTYNLLAEQKQKESESLSKSSSSKNDKKIDMSDVENARKALNQINPTYVTKASKK